MYESPIDIIYGEMQTQIENDVLKAVQRVGVNVNKEELLKALQYDREQYLKGYEDGLNANRWIPCSERLPKIGEKVLTCREGMSEQIVVDSYEVWTDDFGIFRKEWDHGGECVTAWMPLPEPYKGE